VRKWRTAANKQRHAIVSGTLSQNKFFNFGQCDRYDILRDRSCFNWTPG